MRARRGGVERATVAAASIVLVLVVVLVSYFAVYNSGAIQSTGGVGYQPAQTSSQSTYSATSSASQTSQSGNSSLTPFGYPQFMTFPGCSQSDATNGTAAAEPCWGGFSQAHIFNCAAAASSPSGCEALMPAVPAFTPGPGNQEFPTMNNTLTVWYGSTEAGNSSGPSWANCHYQVQFFPIAPSSTFGYCASLNSTAFVIAYPAGPPVPE
jgi:hypothetical protein